MSNGTKGRVRNVSSNETTPKLRFTGERLIPGETDPDLFNEHFARYLYARMFCSGKIVLDTGCGVGYGSLYLAECARGVVGVDNDPATIQYARSRYCGDNTHYVVGDCQSLPFPRESFQVVTSFELIEHLPDADAYLAEVLRVLEPKGLFLVSTPNRPVYAEHRGSKPNPFHVREWDFDEFVSLLRSYFRFVEVLGGTHLPAVGILGSGKGTRVSASVESSPAPAAADYFVCVCSREPQSIGQILFTSSSANVLPMHERHIKSLQNELEEHRTYIRQLIVHRVALSTPGSRRSAGHVRVSNPSTLSRNVSPTAPSESERPKVLMVCAYLPCLGVHSGGNTMFHLIRSLSKRHRLSILSFYDQESELEHIERLSPYCERLEVIRRGRTLDAPNLFGLKPPEIVYEFHHEGMHRLVEDYLRAYDFDLIQCEFVQVAHYANIDPSLPAVLSVHELLSLAYLNRYRGLPWLSSKKFNALTSWMRMLNYEEKMLRRFSGAVVLTRPEREFLAQYAPKVRVYDHPTGVDSEFFRCGPEEPEEGSVVFVGNFRHTPNLTGIGWFLKEAWPKIRARHSSARLCIVGANPPSALKELNGQNGITVTGWVDDVRPFLRHAAVFVAPIFDGVGLRGKVLEAWAMERPVVGTLLAFEGLMSGDGTISFMADDAERFATRTCQLLENRELSRRMGRQARELVLTSFSWDAFGELYEIVYREVLGTKRQYAALQPSAEVELERPKAQGYREASDARLVQSAHKNRRSANIP